MAKLNSGTRIYGNVIIDTFATINGNLNAVGGNVNISNGGTVTAITRTAGGGPGYTSFPAIVISAPTTAGGVQATATVSSMFANTATVASGGTGYTNGDVLTIVGGTVISSAATYTVTAVSGGVVTAVSPLNFNQYSVLPTNPVSTTGGTGTGATLNLTYGVGTVAFVITNAGSGYVEQPTVTFSGGGSSGAAAYATVGSGTVVRSLGINLSIVTPGGTAFQASDLGTTTTDFVQTLGANNGAYLGVAGSSTNPNLFVSSKGTGSIGLFTNGAGNTRQLNVTHTASAVNYVQVTGAATGGSPTISAQGSGTNLDVIITPKGTGNLASTGNITTSGFVKTTAVVVASLPAAASAGAGARSFVTDATAATFGTVAAGGAANAVPVWSDGTNWKIG